MSTYEFEGRVPKIGREVYIHPSADVIGLVTLGDGCFVGPGARIRGDYGEIIIGRGTSIEDNCVVHARPGDITPIGHHVTIATAASSTTPLSTTGRSSVWGPW